MKLKKKTFGGNLKILDHEKKFLAILTLVCMVIAFVYTIFYFILDLDKAGFINIVFLFLYSIPLLFIRYKISLITKLWTISIYVIQIFVLSFVFFPVEAGLHYYFIVVPLVIILIDKKNFTLIKAVYTFIPISFFVYIELFHQNFNPIYPLNDVLARFMYFSSITFAIFGLGFVIYSFLSEKEKLIKEIQSAQTYAESLFNFSPCAIYTTDMEKKVLDFNIQAERISGYSLKELENKQIKFISGRSLITKTGKVKTIERYSSVLYDEIGNPTGFIESFIDITKKIELEDFKTGMERVIRHDLKTPLNTILGFPEMMLEDDTISEENKEYLEIILHSGRNMLNLINASQELYKIEQGTYKFTKETADVLLILKRIKIDLEELLNKKHSSITLLVNDQLPEEDRTITIETESTLFYMILTNLIKNALEASPATAEVLISITLVPSFTLTIHNEGAIPEHIRSSFFNKYVTFGKKKGNGVGTYSAKIMTEAIGGSLGFTTSEDEGTTLTLSLPG